MHIEARREVHAYTASAPDINHSVGHFQQQASTIFQRPTVLVCALVGAGQQELFKQVAVCAVHFHAVKACCLGVFCTDSIGLDDVTDFSQFQRTWRWQRGDRTHQADMAFGSNGTRRDRRLTVQV
ncbi:Superfamily II RNA helicase [Pseudomonas syringae pv. actinidiae]|uniref:Superfamily II RNA helicase n=1 Tax=Pseudomonas syringae pv. actinidiae TaxID=103796 RepID=A0AAN4QA87_PSESF|nr:Superfamily II RNA helicase [Pseudomonas syringae pv. actinidiae]